MYGGTVCESRNALMISENMPAEGISQNQIPKDHGLFRCYPEHSVGRFLGGNAGIAVAPQSPFFTTCLTDADCVG